MAGRVRREGNLITEKARRERNLIVGRTKRRRKGESEEEGEPDCRERNLIAGRTKRRRKRPETTRRPLLGKRASDSSRS